MQFSIHCFRCKESTHENVVNMYGYLKANDRIYILMELADGDMRELMENESQYEPVSINFKLWFLEVKSL